MEVSTKGRYPFANSFISGWSEFISVLKNLQLELAHKTHRELLEWGIFQLLNLSLTGLWKWPDFPDLWQSISMSEWPLLPAFLEAPTLPKSHTNEIHNKGFQFYKKTEGLGQKWSWKKLLLFFALCVKVLFSGELYLSRNRKGGGNVPLRTNPLNYFPRVSHVLQKQNWTYSSWVLVGP